MDATGESDTYSHYAVHMGDIWEFSEEGWMDLLVRIKQGRDYTLQDYGNIIEHGPLTRVEKRSQSEAYLLLKECCDED